MATEDFTTYTEDDQAGAISKTSSRVTVSSFHNFRDYGRVYYDKGAGHFGNFEHLTDMKVTAIAGNWSQFIFWSVADAVGTFMSQTSGLMANFRRHNDGTLHFILQERYNSSNYVDASNLEPSLNTMYYLTIARTDSAFSMKIYSDASRSNLLETLTLTLQDSSHSTRYIYGCRAFRDDQADTRTVSGYCENLDLQEAVALASKRLLVGVGR